MHTRWLRMLALLPAPLACGPSTPGPATPGPSTTASSAMTAASTPEPAAAKGCYCRKHKSDSQFSEGRPMCAVGDVDWKGVVCEAGNPAEGPLPPPDLPA